MKATKIKWISIIILTVLAVVILLVFLLKDKTVKEGNYVLENGKNENAVLSIQADNKYSFGASLYSSHLGLGTYHIEDDILICTEDDTGEVYKFKIINSKKLSIMTEESSKISEPGTEYKIQDGDIFVFEEEKSN